MRLSSVALFGFKSFADRTEIQILPGITAIVGPNGCGKTNIADALRWALGEQSPKALRGHRMEDVIFHGSTSRRPLGFAEALLTFSNDGDVPVPWSEVSVGRRLYRDGESEYLLNKTACRLKDIHDLFLGTGVNPKAYALMEQERLAHILTARPLDRRLFVEEAAGITRYKQQRAETLGKLEATRQNLLRVRDVMDEVKRQLASLERQAKKAKQYKALQAERRALELALLAGEYVLLVEEEATLAEREGAASQRGNQPKKGHDPLPHRAQKPVEKRPGQVFLLHRPRQQTPSRHPHRRLGEGRLPPLPPPAHRACANADQCLQARQPRGRRPFPHRRHQHHDRTQVDPPAEEAKRWRSVPPPASLAGAAEAEPPSEVRTQPAGLPPRAAAIIGPVKHATAEETAPLFASSASSASHCSRKRKKLASASKVWYTKNSSSSLSNKEESPFGRFGQALRGGFFFSIDFRDQAATDPRGQACSRLS